MYIKGHKTIQRMPRIIIPRLCIFFDLSIFKTSQGLEKYVLNSLDEDFFSQPRTLADQLNATLVLDAVGGAQTQQLLDAAPFGSTVLLYSNLFGRTEHVQRNKFDIRGEKSCGFLSYEPHGQKKFSSKTERTLRMKRFATMS